jgi:hypothetical protein
MTPEERQELIDRAMQRLAKLREREELVPKEPELPAPPSIVKRGGA